MAAPARCARDALARSVSGPAIPLLSGLMVLGDVFYIYGFILIEPYVSRLPARLQDGFLADLGFGDLKRNAERVLSLASDMLSSCGVAVGDECIRRSEPAPSEVLRVARWKREMEEHYLGTLAVVQTAAADQFIGLEAFEPTAEHLGAIFANIRIEDEPCAFASYEAYCAIHEHAGQVIAGHPGVVDEVTRITHNAYLRNLSENAVMVLPGLTSIPMFLVIFSIYAWLAQKTILPKLLCCVVMLQGLLSIVWLVLSTVVCAVGLELYWELGLIPMFTLEGRPSLSDVSRHVRQEFPQFWHTLFGGMPLAGTTSVLVGWAIFEVFAIVAVATTARLYVQTARSWRMSHMSAKRLFASLERDIIKRGPWSSPLEEELQELQCLKPCQLRALAHVRSHCAKLHAGALPRLKARVRQLGFTPEDLDRTFQWIREEAPIIIHLKLEDCGALLAKDTHYRNQFETLVSGGTLSRNKRRNWECQLFCGAYSGASPFDCCKYGVLNVVNDPQGVRACQQYGSSYLLLRGVRLRTTLSPSDSAGKYVDDLATVDCYAHVLNRYRDPELQAVLGVGTQGVLGADSRVLQSYKEAQIHGEVRLADHVELIMAHASLQHSPRLVRTLRTLARHCGTDVVWIIGGIAKPILPPDAEWWEVEVKGDWIVADGKLLVAVRDARTEGHSRASYESKGYRYEIDLDAGIQLNTVTGHRHRIRCRHSSTAHDDAQ